MAPKKVCYHCGKVIKGKAYTKVGKLFCCAICCAKRKKQKKFCEFC